MSEVENSIARAVVPPWPDDVPVPWPHPSADPAADRLRWHRRAEARRVHARDRGEIVVGLENVPFEPRKLRPEPDYNPAWERFGFRGQVTKLLFECGHKRKAVRWANCQRLGRPGDCMRYPLEHKFFVLHGCSVIFCPKCALQQRKQLFLDYLSVILSVLRERGVPPGWVLARVNFTLRSDGSEITPDRLKKMNAAIRGVMRKSVGSRNGYGMLFLDEVGHELRGHSRRRRKARGLNPHAHALFFGPRLDWQKTRDLWMQETEKRFGVPSTGFWITEVKGWREDPERALRRALNHMLKYVSKAPAVSPERLASLIAAFDGARRIHSLGLFYGIKPERKKRDCPCPKCRAMGIGSVVSFEGRVLPSGGCVPRLVPIGDLCREGYELLTYAGRAAVLSMGVGREDSWGNSP